MDDSPSKEKRFLERPTTSNISLDAMPMDTFAGCLNLSRDDPLDYSSVTEEDSQILNLSLGLLLSDPKTANENSPLNLTGRSSSKYLSFLHPEFSKPRDEGVSELERGDLCVQLNPLRQSVQVFEAPDFLGMNELQDLRLNANSSPYYIYDMIKTTQPDIWQYDKPMNYSLEILQKIETQQGSKEFDEAYKNVVRCEQEKEKRAKLAKMERKQLEEPEPFSLDYSFPFEPLELKVTKAAGTIGEKPRTESTGNSYLSEPRDLSGPRVVPGKPFDDDLIGFPSELLVCDFLVGCDKPVNMSPLKKMLGQAEVLKKPAVPKQLDFQCSSGQTALQLQYQVSDFSAGPSTSASCFLTEATVLHAAGSSTSKGSLSGKGRSYSGKKRHNDGTVKLTDSFHSSELYQISEGDQGLRNISEGTDSFIEPDLQLRNIVSANESRTGFQTESSVVPDSWRSKEDGCIPVQRKEKPALKGVQSKKFVIHSKNLVHNSSFESPKDFQTAALKGLKAKEFVLQRENLKSDRRYGSQKDSQAPTSKDLGAEDCVFQREEQASKSSFSSLKEHKTPVCLKPLGSGEFGNTCETTWIPKQNSEVFITAQNAVSKNLFLSGNCLLSRNPSSPSCILAQTAPSARPMGSVLRMDQSELPVARKSTPSAIHDLVPSPQPITNPSQAIVACVRDALGHFSPIKNPGGARRRLTHRKTKPKFDLDSLEEKVKLCEKWKYLCPICLAGFDKGEEHRNHMNDHKEMLPFRCETCDQRFTRKESLKKHVIQQHEMPKEPIKYECSFCPKIFVKKKRFQDHQKTHGDRVEKIAE